MLPSGTSFPSGEGASAQGQASLLVETEDVIVTAQSVEPSSEARPSSLGGLREASLEPRDVEGGRASDGTRESLACLAVDAPNEVRHGRNAHARLAAQSAQPLESPIVKLDGFVVVRLRVEPKRELCGWGGMEVCQSGWCLCAR